MVFTIYTEKQKRRGGWRNSTQDTIWLGLEGGFPWIKVPWLVCSFPLSPNPSKLWCCFSLILACPDEYEWLHELGLIHPNSWPRHRHQINVLPKKAPSHWSSIHYALHELAATFGSWGSTAAVIVEAEAETGEEFQFLEEVTILIMCGVETTATILGP